LLSLNVNKFYLNIVWNYQLLLEGFVYIGTPERITLFIDCIRFFNNLIFISFLFHFFPCPYFCYSSPPSLLNHFCSIFLNLFFCLTLYCSLTLYTFQIIMKICHDVDWECGDGLRLWLFNFCLFLLLDFLDFYFIWYTIGTKIITLIFAYRILLLFGNLMKVHLYLWNLHHCLLFLGLCKIHCVNNINVLALSQSVRHFITFIIWRINSHFLIMWTHTSWYFIARRLRGMTI